MAPLERALAAQPDDTFALSWKAAIHVDAGEYKQALSLFDRVIELGAGNDWVSSLRAWSLEYLGRAEEALDAWREAVDAAPHLVENRAGVGDALRALGRYAEAEREYRSVIEQAQGSAMPDADLVALVGWCHLGLREYEVALRLFGEALSLSPELYGTRFDIPLALASEGLADDSLRAYRHGIGAVEVIDPLLRQGYLTVALLDLKRASEEERIPDDASASVRKAEGLLRSALRQTRDEIKGRLEKPQPEQQVEDLAPA